MTKTLSTLALAFALTVAGTAWAQEQTAPVPTMVKPSSSPTVPIRVQIVVSRFQGEKKISSLPYTLSVNANAGTNRASLRMGAQVPVTMMAMANGPVQYKDIGTNIDCDAQMLDDGRVRIQVIIDDGSVYPDDHAKETDTIGRPSFRSFRATDSIVLKDGATAQLTAATDKISGETVKIDVTLTVVK